MKAVVFVPGIMGTELFLGQEKVWPPKAHETLSGYERIEKLMHVDVRGGDIVSKVLCFDVYEPILDQFHELGFREHDPAKRLYLFPYDWRKDLEVTAGLLAAQLDRVHGDGATEIYLVAHSMGGLISRLVLEPPTYRGQPWFQKLRLFAALATPHQGAPLALARVLGLDSSFGISKSDMRRLGNDRRYPSGYQLLPAPKELACWDSASPDVGAVDIYDPAVAGPLGLDIQLIARARFVHQSFANGQAPEHVRYIYFCGTGHETVTRVNVERVNGTFPIASMVLTKTEDAGDGTVPFWSALPRAGQKQIVVNEHSKVFRGMPFKRVFYRLLGGNLGSPLEAAALGPQDPYPLQDDVVRLSIPEPVVNVKRPIELLIIPVAPTGDIKGDVVLQRVDERGDAVAGAGVVLPVSYSGPRLSRLRLELPPVGEPGFYEVRFESALGPAEPLRFAAARIE